MHHSPAWHALSQAGHRLLDAFRHRGPDVASKTTVTEMDVLSLLESRVLYDSAEAYDLGFVLPPAEKPRQNYKMKKAS